MALTHYLDLRLRPDPELNANHALAALFSRLHLHLVSTASNGTAVSFPGVTRSATGQARTLGKVLRLHGSAQALAPLTTAAVWGGAASTAHVGEVQPVPGQVQHLRIRRVQFDTNPERLMRRAMRRKGWTESQARERYADFDPQLTRLPFLALTSQSSRQVFRLFLDVSQPQQAPAEGSFNAYGLSRDATVPSF